jgi:hypothetical protein
MSIEDIPRTTCEQDDLERNRSAIGAAAIQLEAGAQNVCGGMGAQRPITERRIRGWRATIEACAGTACAETCQLAQYVGIIAEAKGIAD